MYQSFCIGMVIINYGNDLEFEQNDTRQMIVLFDVYDCIFLFYHCIFIL